MTCWTNEGVAPAVSGSPPDPKLLRLITESQDLATLNRALDSTYLNLTVSTDEKPFFFNEL